MPTKNDTFLQVNDYNTRLPYLPQRLSRSPHPYHRRGPSSSNGHGLSHPSSDVPAVARPEDARCSKGTYFDTGHKNGRRVNESQSDSGTEADDEKGAFLLGLPAPPPKPRKGLKTSSETTSPLLTPSCLDDECQKSIIESQTRRRFSPTVHSTDEDTIKIREKFTRRRRAELIRRITENALLLAVCYIAVQGYLVWPWNILSTKVSSPGSFIFDQRPTGVRLAVISYVTIVLSLYASYPLRIIYNNHAMNAARNKNRFYIHLPAAFDPAPLIYPVLLPVILAWSIAPDNLEVLLPNMILGIASMPSKIIPFGNLAWYGSPQWAVSTLPVVMMPVLANGCPRAGLGRWPDVNGVEGSLLLYPLHQTLLPILQYLTTTSLLPAELQLLSTSMINLLILSTSPQARILQVLLWMGGVLLLVFCNTVLSWGVALARIPSWRFRKPPLRAPGKIAALDILDDALGGRLSAWGIISHDVESSSSDEGSLRMLKGRSPNPGSLKIPTKHFIPATELSPLHQVSTTPISAFEDGKAFRLPAVNGNIKKPLVHKERYRRNTLPTSTASSADSTLRLELRRVGSQIIQSSKSQSFRSLTASQATVLRWLFAFYVYVVAIAIIILPVRTYVRKSVLLDSEPVGWALGYLFGDLPFFRSFIEVWGIDKWIPLASWTSNHTKLRHPIWNAYSCRSFMGHANARLLICIYCLSIIVFGLVAVFRLSATVEVDTRRKVFHGMMVAMFLPTVFIDPAFVSLALILILNIFLLLDLFRAAQLPPISKPLTYFLAPYVDGRDHRGPVIVSHIFLLIGCAIPLWFSLASIPRTGNPPWKGWEVEERDMGMVAGVVCVGMGDAAASLIGRRYGRRRWCWTGGKSLEGSLAFVVAVLLGLSASRLWLLLGGWNGDSGDSAPIFLTKAAIAASGASLTEAVLTGGNDNVIVPVILWLLIRGLKM